MKRKFKPPTLQEIKEYIAEKDWFLVDAECFFNYYNENDWHDKDDKPVKRWKGKVVTWHYRELRKAKGAICSAAACRKKGIYSGGRDDTGCRVWYCEIHRPKYKPSLPKEIIDKTAKALTVPKHKTVNINSRRNELMEQLTRN